MKKIIKHIIMVVSLLLMVGCGDELAQPSNEQAKGGELLVNFSSVLMKKTLIEAKLADEETTVFGYKAYKVPYTTTNEEGEEVKVSGLFVIPTGLPTAAQSLGLSMVSDDHGTIFANSRAPSVSANNNGTPDGSAIILTALGGFATLQPDYIGFGDSVEHYHPFVLKDSLANATVDFIKQVKIFAVDNNITLNNQLFLTGYSEGGYAAMATLKKIEEETTGLTVSMTAPMAGPYAVKTMADAVLSTPKLAVPSFMANLGYAYAKANDQVLSTLINEPYASKLPTLLNGDINRTEIDAELTVATTGASGLFVQNFVSDYFTNESNWFKEAVIQNNVHTWVPTTSVKLVHCQGDDVIPYAISELTEGTMTAMGASSVSLVPVEQTLGLDYNVTHGACAVLAYKVTTGIFGQVRKASIGY
ncbi:MAG: Lysophospholipase (EC [uncultured Sulfurovum sp.]|uniref:Lysophospholipase (EC) n=1 Tax=uncultured Sulfurovum sp. TaxID=269237 RepID=A0A6S6T178_9BACT|nr:MAG: Lysophospholipase (EC [uncultured Sulfurovum sp.]